MTTATGEEYYAAHISEEKEYVRVYEAHAVKAGETVYLYARAPHPSTQDGYVVNYRFYTAEEFAAKTAAADHLHLPCPREELTEQQRAELTPVAKNDEIYAVDKFNGGMYVQTAEHDGFLVSYGESKVFMSNFEFSSQFNEAAEKRQTEAAALGVIINDNQETKKGILIAEAVTIMHHGRLYTAPAGSILCNEGRTINTIFNQQYRLSQKDTAVASMPAEAHKTALDRQAWLKTKAVKPKVI